MNSLDTIICVLRDKTRDITRTCKQALTRVYRWASLDSKEIILWEAR